MSEEEFSGSDFDQTHAEYLANKKINDEIRRQTSVENYNRARESAVFSGKVMLMTPGAQKTVMEFSTIKDTFDGIRAALESVAEKKADTNE